MEILNTYGNNFFYQWDTNQALVLPPELDGCDAVHFYWHGSDTSFDVPVKIIDGKHIVEVDYRLLEKPVDIIIWGYSDKETRTKFTKRFVVKERQKPTGRAETPAEHNTFESLVNKVNDAVDSMTYITDLRPVGVTSSDSGAKNDYELVVNDKKESTPEVTYPFSVWNGVKGDRGEKGDTGESLTIKKTYPSISAMQSGYITDGLPIGSLVIINTEDVDHPDNAKLFIKGEVRYEYLTDLSGATGIQGPSGEITSFNATVDSNVGTPDVSVVLGGTSSKREITLNFSNMKGEKGDQGIQGVKGNPFTYADFTQEQLDALKVKGDKGDTGPAGPMGEISKAQLDSTLLNYQKKLPLYVSEEGYICYGE